MARTPAELRAALSEAVSRERRDVRVAAATLTLLTVLGTGLLAVVLAHESARGGRTYAWLASGFLSYLYLAFVFSNDVDRKDRPWVVAAGLILGPLFVLGLLTPTPQRWPSLFWTIYAAGAVTAFGFLGMAYQWRHARYFGWWTGRRHVDDPFTLRDDRDRAHHRVGGFVVLPRMIIGGFADLTGRGWMRQPLDEEDVEAAVQLLSRLAVHDRKDVERILRPRVGLWLTKMGLIRRGESDWVLTTDGEKLVGTHGVL